MDQRPDRADEPETIKEATVKRFHYDSHAQLTAHLQNFIDAYNYSRRLKIRRAATVQIYLQSLGKRVRAIYI